MRTPAEQIRVLEARYGNIKSLYKAIGLAEMTLRYVAQGKRHAKLSTIRAIGLDPDAQADGRYPVRTESIITELAVLRVLRHWPMPLSPVEIASEMIVEPTVSDFAAALSALLRLQATGQVTKVGKYWSVV